MSANGDIDDCDEMIEVEEAPLLQPRKKQKQDRGGHVKSSAAFNLHECVRQLQAAKNEEAARSGLQDLTVKDLRAVVEQLGSLRKPRKKDCLIDTIVQSLFPISQPNPTTAGARPAIQHDVVSEQEVDMVNDHNEEEKSMLRTSTNTTVASRRFTPEMLKASFCPPTIQSTEILKKNFADIMFRREAVTASDDVTLENVLWPLPPSIGRMAKMCDNTNHSLCLFKLWLCGYLIMYMFPSKEGMTDTHKECMEPVRKDAASYTSAVRHIIDKMLGKCVSEAPDFDFTTVYMMAFFADEDDESDDDELVVYKAEKEQQSESNKPMLRLDLDHENMLTAHRSFCTYCFNHGGNINEYGLRNFMKVILNEKIVNDQYATKFRRTVRDLVTTSARNCRIATNDERKVIDARKLLDDTFTYRYTVAKTTILVSVGSAGSENPDDMVLQ